MKLSILWHVLHLRKWKEWNQPIIYFFFTNISFSWMSISSNAGLWLTINVKTIDCDSCSTELHFVFPDKNLWGRSILGFFGQWKRDICFNYLARKDEVVFCFRIFTFVKCVSGFFLADWSSCICTRNATFRLFGRPNTGYCFFGFFSV